MAVTVLRQDAAVLALVERWVDLLALHGYDEALGLLLPNAGWTAALLQKVIANYGFVEARSDGRVSVVTPIASATGAGPRAEVTWFQHAWGEVVGDVRFDLPLDGAWSDVTALFDIVAVSEGVVLALDDVHVL
jgi:hypothetical protein